VETIERNESMSLQQSAWAIPATIAALVAGVLVGVWWERHGADSSDLVGVVSVLGSVAVALYTVHSNRERERDRQAHDRAMQTQEFREGRSRLHREEAVRRLIEVRRILGPATPITLDFSRLTHALSNEDEEAAGNRERESSRGFGPRAKAHGKSTGSP
jgi:hypothetical protein